MSLGGWLSIFGGIALAIGLMAWAMRQAGKDAEKALTGERDVQAAKRILESQTHAPRSSDELLDELSNGSREL